MNVFILNSGRCGSTTFIKACQHMTNYSAGHESLLDRIGEQRLAYPDKHIEADNRLCWFLGRLDQRYGDTACYVHLSRNREDTADSFSKRIDFGIMQAYEQGILMHDDHHIAAHDLAHDYLDTVDSNIRCFLKDKSNTITVSLESIDTDFQAFWQHIGAQGDFQSAYDEWNRRYNAS